MRKSAFFIAILLLIIGAAAAYYFYDKYSGYMDANKKPSKDITEVINTTGMPLTLESGFNIEIFAKDLPNARVMVFDPIQNMLVSQTKSGKISHLTIDKGQVIVQKTLIDDLNNPHGMAFLCESNPETFESENCKLYVTEEHQINSYDYDPELAVVTNSTKITSLPAGITNRHFTRTIAFGPEDGRLYVSIGSSCDACEESDQRRAAILSMNPDGTDVKTYAEGLRNAVFFTWSFVDGRMWATEMGRDGLGDDMPPDEINIIEEGKHYGWPYYYGKNIRDEAFEPDEDISYTESYIDLQAHSAPLGLAFIPEEGWSEDYWYDLLVAYHGSWNRSEPTGYKVVRLFLDSDGNYLGQKDFVSGWLTQEGEVYGRPVDILIQPRGPIFISDDKAGVIYKVTQNLLEENGEDNDEPKVYEDILVVNSPQENATINSPVDISGEARGPMYFEAIFRTYITDANGNELGSDIATAIDNWMTEDFVPFSAQITYTQPSTQTGFIVFEKNNASGLPKYDLRISIPVTFGDF